MTVRVGFLGGGFIASYHGKMLHVGAPEAEIALVYDRDVDRAKTFAEASGASVADSEQEVISGCDAVYVCTWTSEHRRLVELVVKAGRPVFCEKPLATNLADARAMVEAVDRAGVTNQIGLVLRDSPSFLYLRHLISEPDNGRVMGVVFRDDQYLPIQGIYESTWRGEVDKAGSGTLLEHSIHDLDLLEWLFGTVVGVTAQTSKFHEIAGIEDVGLATLEFAGGGFASLTSIWHDLLQRPSMRRMEVLCERAFFVLEGDYSGPVRWTRPDESGSVEGEALMAVLCDVGIAPRNPDSAFIDSVLRDGPAYPDFSVALRPHELVDAIYRSAAAGGTPIMTFA